MLDWIASLLMLFFHGNTAKVVANQPNHHTGSGTIHAMDSTVNPAGSSPIIGGTNWP